MHLAVGCRDWLANLRPMMSSLVTVPRKTATVHLRNYATTQDVRPQATNETTPRCPTTAYTVYYSNT